MNTKYFLILGLIMLVIFAGILIFSGYSQVGSSSQTDGKTDQSDSDNPIVSQIPDVLTFDIQGSNFKYNPPEIRVKRGERIRINFVSSQGFHDLVLDEFNIRTKQLKAGGKETVEFTADKRGTYEYYCSVGNHRQMGMVGKLIVE